jgi:hypothetical protein
MSDTRTGALAAVLLLFSACGGGSSSPSSSSSDYPAVKGVYGSYGGLSEGASAQRWISADGTATTTSCGAVTTITQTGAQFSGTVDRLAPCASQATFTGEVARDGSIRFTLTQARWGACSATGPGQYSGIVVLGSLLANGRIGVSCDDGRTLTIEEQITGKLPVPPTTG